MILNTRQDIIDAWNEGNIILLDYYCCPNCRDILYKSDDKKSFVCINSGCSEFEMEIKISEIE